MSISDVEKALANKSYIIGADECGYGSIAGPLSVGAVRAPKDWKIEGLKDSKAFKGDSGRKKRQEIADKLQKLVAQGIIEYFYVEKSNVEIDRVGVYNLLKQCYAELFHKLYQPDSLIIIDGNLKFDGFGIDAYNKVSLIKADTQIPTVMAASILAKTYRDSLMKQLHHQYPQYGWNENVGYWHKNHVAAIHKFGPTPFHRWSYDPVKSMNIPNPNLNSK